MAAVADVLPRTFGPYTLLERLGRGGMAEVILARQEGLAGTSRLVALKRMLPGLASDPDFVQMFTDEVRIVVGLSHPNIGHILDVGEIDGTAYIAMEYIQGRNVEEAMRASGQGAVPLPLPVVLEIGRRVSEALGYAHRRMDATGRPLAIVHCDVTPDNVIVGFDGSVKLVDFGIATAGNRLTHTRAGTLKGKPPYMAPEQILGSRVDARADVFALGVLLYRMVTGVHPFEAASPDRIFRRIVHETPPAPHHTIPDLPEGLSEAVMRALEKAPERRFADAGALGDALDRVIVGAGWIVPPTKLADWLVGLFPEAAAARDRLSRNPHDTLAAVGASYLGTSTVP